MFSVSKAEHVSKVAPWEEGGSNWQASCLVAKQAVEFLQVLASWGEPERASH